MTNEKTGSEESLLGDLNLPSTTGAQQEESRDLLSNVISEQTTEKTTSSDELPQADENGFTEKDGIQYAPREVWLKALVEQGLSITEIKLLSCLVKAGKKPMKGRMADGKSNMFYSKTDIDEVCADLWEK